MAADARERGAELAWLRRIYGSNPPPRNFVCRRCHCCKKQSLVSSRQSLVKGKCGIQVNRQVAKNAKINAERVEHKAHIDINSGIKRVQVSTE